MSILRLLRPHQWTKNLLVFLPIIAAHNLNNTAGLWRTALGFAALCLCASAGYVWNDLLDVDADRSHPWKKNRPLAAGQLGVGLAKGLIPLLAGGGLLCAAAVGAEFLCLSAIYLAAVAAYSLWLKRVAIVDVMTLAGLYTLRVLAGGVSAHVPVSPWLTAFSVFLFLSIAMAKRCAELRNASSARVRSYTVADFDQLARFGTTSAYLAALVLALYIQSAETGNLYSHPLRLWALCPLSILWTSRIWLLASRGELHQDPVLFALRDPSSYLTAAAAASILLLSS